MYLGTFLSPEEIPLEGSGAGNYADVDSGEADIDTERWIYDVEALKFVKAVSVPASETSESVKEKYEANLDTNAFTDLEKEKLSTLVLETSETVKSKYESNPDTNAFTDEDKLKLDSIPTEGVKGDKGEDGVDGLSAYAIAVNGGFEGTEEEWLTSLKGEKGDSTTVLNVNGGGELSFWLGSQEELDLILERDPNTVYIVR